MKELQKIYQRTSKQTQNRLQEIFDSIDFSFNNLYDIANSRTKRKVNTYIEEWKDKGLLKGYFGILANNIYKKSRVKNSEILELLIYSAYIEEHNKLDEIEMKTFKDVANYYYQEGQKEVNKSLKKKKKVSVIPDAIFLALLDNPNSKGYVWNEYKEAILKYNADQIYRQTIIDLQQQKELDITNDIYQNLIKRQNNSRLNINGDKISGDVDLTLIGIDNQAKIEGIYSFDDKAKVKFVAIEDSVTTKECHSLNGQEFYIHDWNEFYRYSKSNDSIKKYRCYGLISGLNLPPINDGFHWCRSYIIYLPEVERNEERWYNKLGNSNKNGIGGSGKGTFIEKIKLEEIPQKLKQYEEDIRNMSIEYGVLIDNKGRVYAYQGTKDNLDITDRKLDNVILTHNHPEIGSFGKDDYYMLKENPNIKELRAVDKEYTYSLKLKKPLDKTYTEIYNQSGDIMMQTNEENQHCVMLKLKELGYIEYDRTRKK